MIQVMILKSRSILSIVFFFVFSLSSCAQDVAQEAQDYIEGKHYISLTQDVKENDIIQNFRQEGQDKVQVVEFFSYGCSWCYKLDPFVSSWAHTAPLYVDFQRVPVEFQPSWRTLTKVYYLAQDLDVLEQIHQPLFKAIHTDELTDSSEDALKAFFVKKGVSSEDFEKSFDSFSVNRKQKWANALSQAYKITSIPIILVQGPKGAYLTSVRMTGGEESLVKVVNYLVTKQQDYLPQPSESQHQKESKASNINADSGSPI
ncbi:thiol:disulfide interchange protein DsbA/DsbL [Candidatus Berkiella cookevillensis]|uniref:Thiol:disulfide interchange protein DsbA n=2 Tax=Candidatus Berkiella cookevillensis TaxID=437022 RepID=A0AAE3HUE8_9GAMM|nr:thiol:disulfide interchange protein DsbA/DsbL [Candidatus Berkiella cookevillensis]MCS5709704.1 thiol:disulfide interchange protein DsbA/DsbL [Candidatus Berkiella cookevillensis]